jgi:hypothetical protein
MRCESPDTICYIRVGTYRVFVGKLEGKRLVGRPGVNEKLKLKLILDKSEGGGGIGKD